METRMATCMATRMETIMAILRAMQPITTYSDQKFLNETQNQNKPIQIFLIIPNTKYDQNNDGHDTKSLSPSLRSRNIMNLNLCMSSSIRISMWCSLSTHMKSQALPKKSLMLTTQKKNHRITSMNFANDNRANRINVVLQN